MTGVLIMVKRLYTKTKSDCLNDIVAVVEQSSNVNMAQMKKVAGRYPIAHTCGPTLVLPAIYAAGDDSHSFICARHI